MASCRGRGTKETIEDPMFEQLTNWLRSLRKEPDAPRQSALSKSGAFQSPAPGPRAPRTPRKAADGRSPQPAAPGTPEVAGAGPGKNVLIRNRYRREDTGTHETLTILDDSMVDSGEETGIDPYNTGNFDRSKNWDKRFRNR